MEARLAERRRMAGGEGTEEKEKGEKKKSVKAT